MHTEWNERIKNWAPEPPGNGWERLAEALPEVKQAPFSQKLFAYSPPPPPSSWDVIAGQLEQKEPETPVIRMFPRNKWLRIGSVAASFLASIFLFRSYFGENSAKNRAPSLPVTQESLIPIGKSTSKSNEVDVLSPAAPDSQNIKATRNSNAVAFLPASRKTAAPLQTENPKRANIEQFYTLATTKTSLPDNQLLERYIIVETEEEVPVRLPKKLYALYRCDDQPVPSDCREKIEALRKQIAAPSLLTPADFLGLLEVIQKVDGPK